MSRPVAASTNVIGGVRFYEREDRPGKWRVFWQENGRQREANASSRDEAERIAIRLWQSSEAELRPGAALNPDLPFWIILEAWLNPDAHADWRSPNTLAKKRSVVSSLVKPRLGHIPARDLTPAVINRALADLADQGYKASTIREALVVIKAAVSWGQDQGAWDQWARPLKGVGLPKTVHVSNIVEAVDRALEVPTRSQVESLAVAMDGLRSGEGLRLGLMVRVAASSGLRLGEQLGLLCGDVLPSRKIRVVRQARECAGKLELEVLPKHGKTRTTVVGRDVAEELAEAMAGRSASALVFPTRRGGPWRRSNFGPLFREARLKSEYPDHLTWHSLRHFFCVDLLDKGVKPATVTELAGHHSTRFTLERYVGASSDYLDEALGAT